MRQPLMQNRAARLVPAVVLVLLAAGCASSWMNGQQNAVHTAEVNQAGPYEAGAACCAPGASCARCKPPAYCSPWYIDCVDDFLFRKKASRCANTAMKRYEEQSGQELSSAFRAGVRQAYIDLADGSWGLMPAVPPEEYWKAEHRRPAGQHEAQQWFAGYDSGVQWARQDGIDQYRKVATPGMHSGY
ncbi:MAG: hypothetical protein KDA79_11590 [Planctomycetaceae bacterium]|nr:hypothetical protein [Planctomycetaceae bacterium]